MKNLKFILLFTLFVGLFGCGDTSTDPIPNQPIHIAYWDFQSAVVTPNVGSPYTVTSLDCVNLTAPAFRVEYDLISEINAIQKSPCSPNVNIKYTTKFVNGKLFEVVFDYQGQTKYYTNIVIDENLKTLTATQQTFNTAKSIVVTFKLV